MEPAVFWYAILQIGRITNRFKLGSERPAKRAERKTEYYTKMAGETQMGRNRLEQEKVRNTERSPKIDALGEKNKTWRYRAHST